jgi:hypothetical protein
MQCFKSYRKPRLYSLRQYLARMNLIARVADSCIIDGAKGKHTLAPRNANAVLAWAEP